MSIHSEAQWRLSISGICFNEVEKLLAGLRYRPVDCWIGAESAKEATGAVFVSIADVQELIELSSRIQEAITRLPKGMWVIGLHVNQATPTGHLYSHFGAKGGTFSFKSAEPTAVMFEKAVSRIKQAVEELQAVACSSPAMPLSGTPSPVVAVCDQPPKDQASGGVAGAVGHLRTLRGRIALDMPDLTRRLGGVFSPVYILDELDRILADLSSV